MAENINISFTPNRRSTEKDRVTAVEDHLKLFTDRTKFCLSGIYDDFAEMGKELKKLEAFSLTMPSSTNLNVDSAVIVQEQESQQIIHNFTKTHYVKGNSIGIGGVGNSIVVGGYVASTQSNLTGNPDLWYSELRFPKLYWNNILYTDARIYLEVTQITGQNLLVGLRIFGNGEDHIDTSGGFTVSGRYGIAIERDIVYPPDEDFEYGSVTVASYTYDEKHCITGHYGERFRLPFQSEAEYNAAIGLTNSPLELIKIQDFQYLMPESQVIVDKSLSPDSDNVIANSAVSEALSLKADKETVEKLSNDYESAKTDFDTRIKTLSSASGNHGIILHEIDNSLTAHIGDKANPHEVTKAQIGLSKVENKSSSEILSELEIGGRNYIVNSNFTSGTNNWTLDAGCTIDETTLYKGNKTLKIDVESETKDVYIGGISNRNLSNNPLTLSTGETLTISCDYYISSQKTYDSSLTIEIRGDNGDTGQTNAIISSIRLNTQDVELNKWKRLIYTFSSNGNFKNIVTNNYISRNGLVWLANFKVEKGNKATDWTPAPEDTATKIESYEQRIAALEAAILSLGGET